MAHVTFSRKQLPVIFVANHSSVHMVVLEVQSDDTLNFPRYILHVLGEVDILGIVLSRVYSGTILPIFIEIASYLTDMEQKITVFFAETRCIIHPEQHNMLACLQHAYLLIRGSPDQ